MYKGLKELKAREEERDRANGIIERLCDVDMSQDEVFDLLVQNGISHQVATGIAQDMRPE